MKTLIAFVAGCLVTAGGMTAYDAMTYVGGIPPASVATLSMPMTPADASPATIRSGRPNFRAAAYTVAPNRQNLSGVWAADGPSNFDWAYTIDEAVYINEGQVDIDYQGRKFTLKPGDTAFFRAGTKANWTVPNFVRKSWTIYHPSLAVRLYRRFAKPAEPAGPAAPANPQG